MAVVAAPNAKGSRIRLGGFENELGKTLCAGIDVRVLSIIGYMVFRMHVSGCLERRSVKDWRSSRRGCTTLCCC